MNGKRLACPISSRLALIFASALLLAVASMPSMAAAQGTVKGTFGAWNLECATPPGARAEQCALVQRVIDQDRPGAVGLAVIVLKAADNKTWILRALAPLGVLLPSRLGLKIDETDVGNVEFQSCATNGCFAQAIMQDELIEKFKTGKEAVFIIFKTPEQGIGIPVTLEGFSAGMEKLR